MPKMKLIDLLDTNTGISRWDYNRERLNTVINLFNHWQIVHRFEPFQKEIVQANIQLCRKYANENEFSDWQFELLDEMDSFLLTFQQDTQQTIKLMELLDTNTGITWWDANRKRLNNVIILFNDWQTIDCFDNNKKEVVKINIELCRIFGKENEFSDWQFEMLDEMDAFILAFERNAEQYL